MIRLLLLAASLLATPAAAMDLCVDVPAPAHKPIASKPRAITAVQVSRVYIVIRRATRASDVRLLCPVEEPAEVVPMVVAYGSSLPEFPSDLNTLNVPGIVPEMSQETSRDNWPQLHADRSLYLGPAIQALTPSAIPEPSSWLATLMGFTGLGLMMRSRRAA